MERTDSTAIISLQSMYGDASDDEIHQESGAAVDNISDEEAEHAARPSSSLMKDAVGLVVDEKPYTPASSIDDDKKDDAKKTTRLVSYLGEDDYSESDDSSKDVGEESSGHEGEGFSNSPQDSKVGMPFMFPQDSDGIKLPPTPPGKCSRDLQETIRRQIEKCQRDMTDMNASIQHRKEFRNPSIYEKFIEICNIDEKGSNFPPEIYNPYIWGKESFYDELDKAQKKEMEKREKEKKERTKIEFMTGTKRTTTPVEVPGAQDEKKRKTKWDTQPPPGAAVMRPLMASAGVVNPISLTTTVSGTKGTIIPATGSITKKPMAGQR